QIRVLIAGRSGIYEYVAESETDGVSGGTWTVRDTGLVNSAHYNKVDPVPWMGSVFFDPREGCENVVYASKSSNVKNVLGDWGEMDNLNHDYPEGNTKAAIYKSTDGGITWTDIHSGTSLPQWFQIRHVTVSSTGRLCANAWDAGLYMYSADITPAENADINDDGDIDYADFAVISAYFMDECVGPLWCQDADMNMSGAVDPNDVRVLAENWIGSL
ncbi:MAG: hypothetical protein KAR47_03030, partial [Planctomycetes bacterium]|nr:hypothetical protein [Planctomycetota bacterium]